MGPILLYLAGILGGALAVTQGGCNLQLKKSLNAAIPPIWFSYLSGALAVAIYSLITRVQPPALERFPLVPWWAWIGGAFGAAYVIIQLTLAEKVGGGTMTGLLVTGQIIFSILLDNYGWIGFEKHPASLPRIAGACLMIGGLVLVAKF